MVKILFQKEFEAQFYEQVDDIFERYALLNLDIWASLIAHWIGYFILQKVDSGMLVSSSLLCF